MTPTTAATEQPPCRWESGELGASIEHARPVSAQHEAATDAALGLQLVQLRLPEALLDDLALIADERGLARPALIRRVLAHFAAAEFRTRAHEELAEFGKKVPTAAQLTKEEAPFVYG